MKDPLQHSRLISRGPCLNPLCATELGCVSYDDGHSFCFSCDTYFNDSGEGSAAEEPPECATPKGFVDFTFIALKKRGISKKICERYAYGVGKDKSGNSVQVANYYDPLGKELIAQKTRDCHKKFTCYGDITRAGLFGQQLFEPYSKIVITEGELDALSVAEAFTTTRMPSVSLRNGASGVSKCLKNSLEWLSSFGKIIICFDQDEPGKKAAEEAALLLPPGKVWVANLSLNDANAVLVEKGEEELRQAIWSAKEWRPDGVLTNDAIWDRACELHGDGGGESYSLPWVEISEAINGWRRGEILTLCGGTGSGKSQMMKEIVMHFRTVHDLPLGYLGLEENTKQTMLDLIAIRRSERLRKLFIPDMSPYYGDFEAIFGNDQLCLYDHFGSLGPENLLSRIRYMIRAHDLPFLFLDHLSIAVSGLNEGDERKTIDYLMTNLRSLAEETQAGIGIISHLKRPMGKGHEEGAPTSSGQLRGSGSIGQLSDTIIGLERNQQADDGSQLDTDLRLLKCRWTGETGLRGFMHFDTATGRLLDGDASCVLEVAGEKTKEDF